MLGAAIYHLVGGNRGLRFLVLGSVTLLVISAFRIRKAGRISDGYGPRAP
jgi:hypothetical protein